VKTVKKDGVAAFGEGFLKAVFAPQSFQTNTGDIIRLDDCLITETAASSNASARFALELQAAVFARQFREPRSDLSDAFDDKFRTDVYWLNGLRASGEFVTEDAAFVLPETMCATGVANFLHLRADSLRFLQNTHHAESIEGGGEFAAAYHNSGCWTENPSTYLTIACGEVRKHVYARVEVAGHA